MHWVPPHRPLFPVQLYSGRTGLFLDIAHPDLEWQLFSLSLAATQTQILAIPVGCLHLAPSSWSCSHLPGRALISLGLVLPQGVVVGNNSQHTSIKLPWGWLSKHIHTCTYTFHSAKWVYNSLYCLSVPPDVCEDVLKLIEKVLLRGFWPLVLSHMLFLQPQVLTICMWKPPARQIKAMFNSKHWFKSCRSEITNYWDFQFKTERTKLIKLTKIIFISDF